MNKAKKFMIVGISILIISLVGATATYAWFTWSSTENTSVTMSIGKASDVVFKTGNDISTNNLSPVFNYTDGEKTSFSIINRDTTGIPLKYTIILNITTISDELKSNNLKYKLLQGSNVVDEGDFSTITDNSTITMYSDSLSVGTINFTFYLYIDGNEENDLNMMNKSITGTITVSVAEKTLVAKITNLYTSAEKTMVTNNSITYNTAPSVNLMNDRLGSSSTDIDGGNIRYYGAEPNNYIYFNCSDYSNQSDSTCEKWRIIGVFEVETPDSSGNYVKEEKVKIIREEKIGEYAYDTSAKTFNSGYGINQWGETTSYEGADLMRLLNPGYDSNSINNSLYWNANSGTCYTSYYDVTKSCDFTSLGLKNDATKNVISKTKWNLGGGNDLDLYANNMYAVERGTTVITSPSEGVVRTTSWDGYIALLYPSDIAYTADFQICTGNMEENFDYDNTTCPYSSSWLASMHYNQRGTSNSNYSFWTLTPGTFLSEFVYVFNGEGYGQNKAASGWSLNNGYKMGGVIPVLYLSPELEINTEGDGTSSNPYQLAVS